MRHVGRLLPLLCALSTADAQTADPSCVDGAALTLGFDSGSSWLTCARIDKQHGLELQSLSWRAPGDADRSVLARLNPAAILVQAHDDTEVESLLVETSDDVLPGMCGGERHDGEHGSLCVTAVASQLLKKFGDIRGVRGAHWRIASSRRHGNTVISTRYLLSEDGRIGAELTHQLPTDSTTADTTANAVHSAYADAASGVPTVATSARVTWRIDPAIDAGLPDRVEEFDFSLDASLGSRRLMSVRPINTETLRQVDHQRFRGWRIYDPAGPGYYLDSQRSVRGWLPAQPNWSRFDIAITRASDDELYAASTSTEEASLDIWVSGDDLQSTSPVVWYSQTLPAESSDGIRGARSVSFELLPFDWNETSPFPLDLDSGS